MLDDHEAQIQAWLHTEPDLSAQVILRRLIGIAGNRFTDKHLRTVQRGVKSWRSQIAHKLILQDMETLVANVAPPLPSERSVLADAAVEQRASLFDPT